MKILFMGTPEFAVPSLQCLIEAGHSIVGVFTQPDKPKNRGMKMQAPPVKELAEKYNIPVFQPKKIKDGVAFQIVRECNPDIIVVVAYGRILGNDILDFPRLGCINVHSSLLPKYRGSAPIHWAILNGETETGVTIMHMAEELDAGDIISQVGTSITPDETVGELHDRLAVMGAQLLAETVREIELGNSTRTIQDETRVSFAPMLTKEMAKIDWEKSAQQIHNHIRGLIPWPSAVTYFADVRCKIWKSKLIDEKTQKKPGEVIRTDQTGIYMACGNSTVLLIEQLQADGKKRMSAAEYLRGNTII